VVQGTHWVLLTLQVLEVLRDLVDPVILVVHQYRQDQLVPRDRYHPEYPADQPDLYHPSVPAVPTNPEVLVVLVYLGYRQVPVVRQVLLVPRYRLVLGTLYHRTYQWTLEHPRHRLVL